MGQYEFWVGTYASEKDESILKYRVDFEERKFVREITHVGTANPSYLLLNPEHPLLYAVEEKNPAGALSVFHIAGDQLEKVCTLPTKGADPCHLSLDAENKFLFVSNYTSGSLAMFTLDDKGMPEEMSWFEQHTGKGANPDRQGGPHVHFSRYHDGKLFVNDLGLDTVFCYEIRNKEKKLSAPYEKIKMPSGSGPRHLCFHPEIKGLMYVVGELSSNVLVYDLGETPALPVQSIRTLPGGYSGRNTGAAIKMTDDGKYLFVSNRGHDSIAVFSAGADRRLSLVDICKTGGLTPRDFSIFDEYLIVANQDSDLLTVLHFDDKSGKLSRITMDEKVVKPVCLVRTQKK